MNIDFMAGYVVGCIVFFVFMQLFQNNDKS